MYTLHVYTNTILFIYRNCNWKSIIYFTGQHCVNDPSISTLSNIQLITKTASKTGKKISDRKCVFERLIFIASDCWFLNALKFWCFKKICNSLKNNVSHFFGTLVQVNGHQNFYEIRQFFFDLKSNFYQNSQITKIQAIRFFYTSLWIYQKKKIPKEEDTKSIEFLLRSDAIKSLNSFQIRFANILTTNFILFSPELEMRIDSFVLWFSFIQFHWFMFYCCFLFN